MSELREIIARLGPGLDGVYVGKGYTLAELKRDLEQFIEDDDLERRAAAEYDQWHSEGGGSFG